MIKNLKRYKKQLEKEGKTEEAAQYIFNIDTFKGVHIIYLPSILLSLYNKNYSIIT